jgi:hypothetical protein
VKFWNGWESVGFGSNLGSVANLEVAVEAVIDDYLELLTRTAE